MCFHLTDNPLQIKYKNCIAATSKKRTKQRLTKGIWQSTVPVDRVTNLSFGSRVAYILIQAERSDPSASQTPMRLVKLGRKHRQCSVYEFPWQSDIYVLEVKHAYMQRQTMSVQRHHIYTLPSCQHCSRLWGNKMHYGTHL